MNSIQTSPLRVDSRKSIFSVSGIYKITSPTGLIYIGQSVYIRTRYNHYKHLRCKDQPALYNSLKKHGWNTHKFEVILECQPNELNKQENYFINFYDSLNNGLNTKSGGSNGYHSEETKKKISLTHLKNPIWKGKKLSEEHRKKISESGKQTFREGRICATKGKKRSKEAIEKSRKYLIGNKHLLGHTHSDETKRKMSESHLLNPISEVHKMKIIEACKRRTGIPLKEVY